MKLPIVNIEIISNNNYTSLNAAVVITGSKYSSGRRTFIAVSFSLNTCKGHINILNIFDTICSSDCNPVGVFGVRCIRRGHGNTFLLHLHSKLQARIVEIRHLRPRHENNPELSRMTNLVYLKPTPQNTMTIRTYDLISSKLPKPPLELITSAHSDAPLFNHTQLISVPQKYADKQISAQQIDALTKSCFSKP